MSHATDDKSLTELIASLLSDIPSLFEQEIRLAKADAAAILDLLLNAIRQLALGSVLAVGAVAVLLAALVSGITATLVSKGMELALAGCIAAGLVAIVAAAISWALFANAIHILRSAKSSLGGSVDTLAFRPPHASEKS